MTIVYHDDKKEKHQSHEARFELPDGGVDQLICDLGYLTSVGYGIDQEEAKQDLINVMKENVEYLKKFTASLEGLIQQHETNRNDGSTRDR